MATQAFRVVNPTGAELTNINGGGDDVPAYSMLESSTLTDIEQAAVLNVGALLLRVTGTSAEQRRLASKILRLGKNPGTATTG